MKKLAHQSLVEYTGKLAQPIPTPGGGSSAALVGALGAALLEMSMGYSKFTPARVAKIRRIRLRLIHLMDEDAKVYAEVVRSWKEGPVQKKKALKDAAKVPREICHNCERALRLVRQWDHEIKKALRSDWMGGKIFLKAAIKVGSVLK